MKFSVCNEGDKVLLIGEANFSFSVSLFKKYSNISITASCHETEILDSAENNVKFLRKNGVRILLGVDATNLKSHPNLKEHYFDRIIFNFPHSGGKMRIEKNRELLRKIFLSVGDILENDGQFIITLCNGQGGTPADNPRRSWNDSWQVMEMAAHGNFLLIAVEPFPLFDFGDYNVTGYRSLEKPFNTKGAITHFFKRVNKLDICKIAMGRDLNLRKFTGTWSDIFEIEKKNLDTCYPISIYTMSFSFDITLSINNEFSVSRLYEILYKFAGHIIEDVNLIASYKFTNSDRETKTYRIKYTSCCIPFYRKRVIDIHQNIVGKILEENLNVIVSR